LQRSFQGRRINTGMTQHHSLLIADTMTDIILYPTSGELRQSPDDPLVIAKARRAVTLFFELLQAVLAKHGHTVSLDRLDHDPDIGWLIPSNRSDRKRARSARRVTERRTGIDAAYAARARCALSLTLRRSLASP
jgi:hypothetical protein